MKSVLFVCTGNVFRSVIAEYALREACADNPAIVAASAGTHAGTGAVSPVVRSLLARRGLDVSGHRPRRLTASLLRRSDLAIAMAREHQAEIRYRHGVTVPLFNALCHAREESIADVHEAIPDWEHDEPAARAYVLEVVDHVRASMPALLGHLGVA